MISMHVIDEPDVLELLNDGRFDGDVEGYIMMSGPDYLGHALFRVAGDVTTVLDVGVEGHEKIDGIVRACIANGDNRGAKRFSVNTEQPELAHWWQVFCKDQPDPAGVDHIFTFC